MIKIGKYAIKEYPELDRLIICLPPIQDTSTTTAASVNSTRKKSLDDSSLATILSTAILFYEPPYFSGN